MKALITGAASAQAQQLKSLLGNDAAILLGDYFDLPDFMIKAGKMIKTPDAGGASFAHEMLTLCLDLGVTDLYSLRLAELLPLAEAKQLFVEFSIRVCIPEREMILQQHDVIAINSQPVVVQNGKAVAGIAPNIPEHIADGIFTIDTNGDYQIFTAI